MRRAKRIARPALWRDVSYSKPVAGAWTPANLPSLVVWYRQAAGRLVETK
jgi:hypothetical protein